MDFFCEKNENISKIISKMNDNDTLFIKSGIYKEKIKITKSNITICGIGDVTITNDDYYNKIHSDNKECLTVRTYTINILGDNVTLKNLTIENSCKNNLVYGQCVALEVLGNNFKGLNLKLLGGQDTLFTGPIPKDLDIRYKNLLPLDELNYKEVIHLYKDCYIEGNIDFIFGGAQALFDNCIICSTGRGFISAPSTSKEVKYGFIFNNCTFINKNAPDKSVLLARPWREYGSSTFINPIIEGNHINEVLFDDWGKPNTCRLNIDSSIFASKMASFGHILTSSELKKINNLIIDIKESFNLI